MNLTAINAMQRRVLDRHTAKLQEYLAFVREQHNLNPSLERRYGFVMRTLLLAEPVYGADLSWRTPDSLTSSTQFEWATGILAWATSAQEALHTLHWSKLRDELNTLVGEYILDLTENNKLLTPLHAAASRLAHALALALSASGAENEAAGILAIETGVIFEHHDVNRFVSQCAEFIADVALLLAEASTMYSAELTTIELDSMLYFIPKPALLPPARNDCSSFEWLHSRAAWAQEAKQIISTAPEVSHDHDLRAVVGDYADQLVSMEAGLTPAHALASELAAAWCRALPPSGDVKPEASDESFNVRLIEDLIVYRAQTIPWFIKRSERILNENTNLDPQALTDLRVGLVELELLALFTTGSHATLSSSLLPRASQRYRIGP